MLQEKLVEQKTSLTISKIGIVVTNEELGVKLREAKNGWSNNKEPVFCTLNKILKRRSEHLWICQKCISDDSS